MTEALENQVKSKVTIKVFFFLELFVFMGIASGQVVGFVSKWRGFVLLVYIFDTLNVVVAKAEW